MVRRSGRLKSESANGAMARATQSSPRASAGSVATVPRCSREKVDALQDGEQPRSRPKVMAEVAAQDPRGVAREAPQDQDTAQSRPQPPAAPLRVPEAAPRAVDHQAEELEDGLAIHAAPEGEAPAPGSRQRQLENAPALEAPGGKHVGVVHVRGHRRGAGPKASRALSVPNQGVWQANIAQRLPRALGDGLIAEVQRPRPPHGHA